MKIDIIPLINNFLDIIEINETLSFDESYIEYTDIKKLAKVKISGNLTKDYDNNIILNINIMGNMTILDTLTNEEIDYPFNINIIDEIIEINANVKNTLDIMPILWENIILEVPSRYTTVDDINNIYGDGWRVVGEEELTQKNNPFNTLKTMEGVDNNGSTF